MTCALRHAVFVFGVPGVGKTSVVRELLGSPKRLDGRWTLGPRCCALGLYQGAAEDGPDGLPRSRAVVEAELLRGFPMPLALFDGLRLTPSDVALVRCKTTGIFLRAQRSTLRARRSARGSVDVSSVWWTQQETRAQRMALASRARDVDAEGPLAAVVQRVRAALELA
jgi:hypothetical protein